MPLLCLWLTPPPLPRAADNIAAQMLQSVFRAHRARKSPRMRRVVELRMQRHRREKIRRSQLIAQGIDPDAEDTPRRKVGFREPGDDEGGDPILGEAAPPAPQPGRGSVATEDL